MPQPVKPSLSRVSRPHRAGKARRPRDPDCRTMRRAAQDRRQGRQGGPRILRRRNPAAARSRRMSSISARSPTREKSAFLSGAIALLVPIDWPEPFGLVMIEAMACGTPVIAFNRGSVPEVIDDGLTGLHRRGREGRGRRGQSACAAVAQEGPQAVRGALHRAPHGAGLSRGLSQLDAGAASRPTGRVAASRERSDCERIGRPRVRSPRFGR